MEGDRAEGERVTEERLCCLAESTSCMLILVLDLASDLDLVAAERGMNMLPNYTSHVMEYESLLMKCKSKRC